MVDASDRTAVSTPPLAVPPLSVTPVSVTTRAPPEAEALASW